ncbi:hypothetical protein XENOCAPTIV_009212, partial [Xenoophorus captivus]
HMCEVVQVLSPYSSANGATPTNSQSRPADGDTIVISDSDDESDAFQSPKPQVNGSVDKKSPETTSTQHII